MQNSNSKSKSIKRSHVGNNRGGGSNLNYNLNLVSNLKKLGDSNKAYIYAPNNKKNSFSKEKSFTGKTIITGKENNSAKLINDDIIKKNTSIIVLPNLVKKNEKNAAFPLPVTDNIPVKKNILDSPMLSPTLVPCQNKDSQNNLKDKNQKERFLPVLYHSQEPALFEEKIKIDDKTKIPAEPSVEINSIPTPSPIVETTNLSVVVSKANCPIENSSYNSTPQKPPSASKIIIESTDSTISRIVTSLIGLDNIGNSCYINTCLQILIHTEPFIMKLFHTREQNSKFTDIREATITKAFYKLSLIFLENVNSDLLEQIDFKNCFGEAHAEFNGYSQHDTQEFCRTLLEDINRELNVVEIKPQYRELVTINKSKQELNMEYDQLFRSRENSIVVDTFYGQFVTIYQCECKYEAWSFDKFLDIPLLLEEDSFSNDVSLYSLLDIFFFSSEKIKWETICEKCKLKTYHEKSVKISSLPEILILSFQRYNGRTNFKNGAPIQFDEVIDMTKYSDPECIEGCSTRYKLYGISNHSGSIDFGHYYAYIKLNEEWYEFNDSHVLKCNKLSLKSRSAYVLFYRRDVN